MLKKIFFYTILALSSFVFAQQRVCAKEGSGWHYYLYKIDYKKLDDFRKAVLETFTNEKNLKNYNQKFINKERRMYQLLLADAKILFKDKTNNVAAVYFTDDAIFFDFFFIYTNKNKYYIEYWEID